MLEQIKEDYKYFMRKLLFWQIILLDENYEDILTKKEIEDEIEYYKSVLIYVRREIKKYGN